MTNDPYQEALAMCSEETARLVLDRAPFRNRKLSDRTIEALVAASIDAPERLLFMKDADLEAIKGIGKAALAEISAYRTRFLPPAKETR